MKDAVCHERISSYAPYRLAFICIIGALVYAGILRARNNRSDAEGASVGKFLALGWVVGISAAWLDTLIKM